MSTLCTGSRCKTVQHRLRLQGCCALGAHGGNGQEEPNGREQVLGLHITVEGMPAALCNCCVASHSVALGPTRNIGMRTHGS